jgi:hypothetical protein
MTSSLAGLNLWSLWSGATTGVPAGCSRPPSRSAIGLRSLWRRWSGAPGWTTRRTRLPGSRGCRPACWARRPPTLKGPQRSSQRPTKTRPHRPRTYDVSGQPAPFQPRTGLPQGDQGLRRRFAPFARVWRAPSTATLVDELVPDQLWAMVEPLLPVPPRPPYGGGAGPSPTATASRRSCTWPAPGLPGGCCRSRNSAVARRRPAGAA